MPERRCPGCSPAGQRWPGAGGKKPQGGPHSLTQSPLFFLLLSALFLSELPNALFHLTLCLFVSSPWSWPLQIWSNRPTSEKQESQYNVGEKSSSTICKETFRLEHSPRPLTTALSVEKIISIIKGISSQNTYDVTCRLFQARLLQITSGSARSVTCDEGREVRQLLVVVPH